MIWRRYLEVIGAKDFILLSVSGLLFGFSFYFFTWYVPILIMRDYGSFTLSFLYIIGTIVGLVTVFSGALADVFGYKPVIVLVPAVLMCSYVSLVLAPCFWSLLFVVLSIHLVPLAGPAIYAYISNSFSEGLLGKAFSLYRVFFLAGLATSSTFFGLVVQFEGYRIALLISAIGLSSVIVLRCLISEVNAQSSKDSKPYGYRSFASVFKVLLSSERSLLLVLTASSIINALSLAYGPYLYNFIRFVLGLNIAFLGIYETLSTILNMLTQVPAGALVDWLGALRSLIMVLSSEILAMVSLTILVNAGVSAVACLIILLVWESLGAITAIAVSVALAKRSPKEVRATAYGSITTLASITSMPLYPLFASIWSWDPVMLPASYAILLIAPISIAIVTTTAQKSQIHEKLAHTSSKNTA